MLIGCLAVCQLSKYSIAATALSNERAVTAMVPRERTVMPKKRTTKPYYGKLNQRLDAQATALTKQGRHEDAQQVRDQSDKVLRLRSGKTEYTGKV